MLHSKIYHHIISSSLSSAPPAATVASQPSHEALVHFYALRHTKTIFPPHFYPQFQVFMMV